MSKIFGFEKNNGRHWILDDGYKLTLFVDEKTTYAKHCQYYMATIRLFKKSG